MSRPAYVAPTRRQALLGGLALAGLGRAGFAQTSPELAPDGFQILRIAVASAMMPYGGPGPVFTWGFGRDAPAPILRVRRGDELRVRLINGRREEGMRASVALHWHGVRVPNAMDGTPPLTQEPVNPDGTFDYRFRPPDAGTFWYRVVALPTLHGLELLCGALIVDDSEAVGVGRDVPVIFSDAGNRPAFINSEFDPAIGVRAGEYTRLRLVNPGRRLLGIQIGEAATAELRLWVMAIDGQPAEPFLARGNRVSLAPGNRADVFVETTLASGTKVPIVVYADNVSAANGHLLIEAPAEGRPPLPASPKPLPANSLPQRLDLARAQRVTVPLEATMPAAPLPRPLFSVRRGRVMVLALANRTEAAQVVHLHGHSARLLDRLDDGWKPFWMDTLLVEPRATERIAFLADNPGKWAIDARALDRDAAGLAGWFEVT